MEIEFNKIKIALNELNELQSAHIESFDKSVPPDIERQSAEREKGFSNLKHRIDLFVRMTGTESNAETESMLQFFNNSITVLLEQNKTLEMKVRAYKESIRSNIQNLSKGKHAIGRYGSASVLTKNPRVINITN